MQQDPFNHPQHSDDVELEQQRHTDHPVLEYYRMNVCPEDNCDYQELVEYEVDHDITLPFDMQTRLNELSEQIDLPVVHTYHSAGGHREGKAAFQTGTEAKTYIFGRYNGSGDKPTSGDTIRKTHSRTHGTHSQVARKKDYPMVCAVIDTYQNKVVYSNLVPREEDVPESTPHWQKSIEQQVDYRLNPPEHIIEGKLGEDDQFARIPNGYDHDALAWHVEQVKHWKFVIQTPELLLNNNRLKTALKLVDEYEPSPAPY